RREQHGLAFDERTDADGQVSPANDELLGHPKAFLAQRLTVGCANLHGRRRDVFMATRTRGRARADKREPETRSRPDRVRLRPGSSWGWGGRLGHADDSTTEAQRRYVSVLFADVCDYTTLGESADPEEIELIKRHVEELAAEVIRKRGGAISQ